MDRAALRPSKQAGALDLWIEELADAAALVALRSDWEDLAREAIEPNPFYEPFMLLPAIESYAANAGVSFLCVFAPHPTHQLGQRRLVALLPIEQHRSRLLPLLRVSAFWKYPFCYLSHPLLRRGYEGPAWARICDWFEKSGARTGIIKCEHVPSEGRFHQLLVDELGRRRWTSVVVDSFTRALLLRRESAQAYISEAIQRKRRSEFRRQRQRL